MAKDMKNKAKESVNKTEVVTLRLDPRTKFGLELLAKKQYRTLSSVVEWSINNALSTEIPDIDFIWDVSEVDRFLNMVKRAPTLLNYEEQLVLKVINDSYKCWDTDNESLDRIYIKENYGLIKKIALGEEKVSSLPNNISHDIPF